jgi:RND family efflux transporter MFP subunit
MGTGHPTQQHRKEDNEMHQMPSAAHRPLWLMAVVALLAGGLLTQTGCKPPGSGAFPAQTAPGDKTATVVAQPAQRGPATHWVTVAGSLAALNDVPISSRIGGRLARVAIREGDAVGAGQAVAELDMADQRSQVRVAEGVVRAAQAKVAQVQAAYRQQIVISRTSVKAAEAAYSQQRTDTRAGIDAAEAALTGAQAQLSQVREGSRRQQIRRAQEQVTIAEAELEKAQADTERYRTLTSQGAAARATLEQYERDVKVARAKLRAAQEDLSLQQEGSRSQEVVQAEQAVRQAEERRRQAKAAAGQDEVRAADLEAARAGVSQVDVRAADVRAAKASLSQAQDSLAIYRKALSDAFIRAPISGRVASRTAEPGEVVNAGQAILRVVALNSVGFEPAVPAQDLALIRVGQRVEVTVTSLAATPFVGSVTVVYPAGSAASRTFTVRISIDNSRGVLRPEMFAQGRILVEQRRQALLVPETALLRSTDRNADDSRRRLFTVENGRAVEHQVTVGLRADDSKRVEVRGLTEGAQVIVEGQADLSDGDKVTVSQAAVL